MVSRSKNNWHTIRYPTLWEWQNLVKTTARFTTFQPVHGVEDILPIEYEFPSLKLVIENLLNTSQLEECLFYLQQLDGHKRDVIATKEEHIIHMKAQHDKLIHPRVFLKGDMVYVYDQDHDELGSRKFNSMWLCPYVVRQVLNKGAY